MVVVNLFGAPGCGKSTGAAYIFAKLKMAGVNAELITEYAKDKVWEGNTAVFSNQAYIFGKQSFRMSRCAEQVDVIVTDSPLPLSIIYNSDAVLGEEFNAVVMKNFNKYNNMNYLLERTKPYNPIGRKQTEAEASVIGKQIEELLHDRDIHHTHAAGDIKSYETIIDEVVKQLSIKK